MNILFVCTGNTCRSPMAEAVLKYKGKDHFKVKSAGVFAFDGNSATPQVEEVLKENNIKQEHQSSSLTKEDLDWATYIFTMTASHKASIANQYPHIADKLFTLKEFVLENPANQDVVDPFGGNVEVYRRTYKELEELIDQLIVKLQRES